MHKSTMSVVKTSFCNSDFGHNLNFWKVSFKVPVRQKGMRWEFGLWNRNKFARLFSNSKGHSRQFNDDKWGFSKLNTPVKSSVTSLMFQTSLKNSYSILTIMLHNILMDTLIQATDLTFNKEMSEIRNWTFMYIVRRHSSFATIEKCSLQFWHLKLSYV